MGLSLLSRPILLLFGLARHALQVRVVFGCFATGYRSGFDTSLGLCFADLLTMREHDFRVKFSPMKSLKIGKLKNGVQHFNLSFMFLMKL